MSHISSYLSSLKGKIVALFAVVMAILVPISTMASQAVRIEAQLGTANVTQGDTGYTQTNTAKVDDVLEFRVWYHNMENPNSGKVAENLRVKVDIPTTPGKTQTITSTVKGSNTNTVVDSNTVTLSLDGARLEYMPGSAEWRHNTGTNENVNYTTTPVSDAVVTGANGLVLEHAQPCFNFEASLVVRARVVHDNVSVVKEVKNSTDTEWQTENTAIAGEDLFYRIIVRNEGNTTLNNVLVGDQLPNGIELVPGSTVLYNKTYPSGVSVDNDKIINGGINIGNYGPGRAAIVAFQAQVSEDLACGLYTFRNKAQVESDETDRYFNIATTTVHNGICEEEEEEEVNLRLKKYVNGEDAQTNATAVATATGETVRWRIVVRNTGPDDATNVVVSDAMPNGISVESNIDASRGSYDAAANEWTIPGLPADSSASLEFDTTVNRKNNGFIRNVATITDVDQEDADGPENNTDPAVIVIDNPTPSDPEYACEAIFTNLSTVSVNQDVRTTVRAIAADGASVVSYGYDFGDGATQTETTSALENSVNHPYAAAGDYTITATITFDVEGETETRTCSTDVTVNDLPEEPVYACDALEVVKLATADDTYKISVDVTAENGAALKHFVYSFGDDSAELVTDQSMVEHVYEDAGTYEIIVRAVFTVDGEMVEAVCAGELTVAPEVCELDESLAANDPKCVPCEYNNDILASDENCDEPCSTDQTISADDPDCGKPKGVTTLPNTGPGAAIVSIFGTGALGVVARGYATSRKALRESQTR